MKLAPFLLILLQTPCAWSQETESTVPIELLAPVRVQSEIDKQGTPLVFAPGSTARKDREALSLQAPQSLSDILKDEPNVDFNGGPRNSTALPQIRGLGASRILILDEGVRQNFQSGHNGRVFVDAQQLEQVEIVKGPWSSLYGSGALGGVISFRRSGAEDLIRRSGRNSGWELALGGGTNNNENNQAVTAFAKKDFFEPLISYRHTSAGDLRFGDGERLAFSGFERHDVFSSLGFELGEKHQFNLKMNRLNETSVTPLNPSQDTSFQNQLGDSRILKEDLVGDYRWSRDQVEFYAKPYWRRTEVRKSRLSDARLDLQNVQTTGVDAWTNLHGEWGPAVTTATVGVESFVDHLHGERNGGPLGSFPDGDGAQTGWYFQPSMKFAKAWTLTPGLRYDAFRTHDASGLSADNKGSQTSAKLSVNWEHAPERNVFAGWGQAFNAPRLQDLYVDGMHFPGNFFVANPDLKPEQSDTFEAGFKNRWRDHQDQVWMLNGTWFLTQARDFIARDVQATTTRFLNRDRVRLEGVELSTGWQSESWGANLSYGQVRSWDQNAEEPLSDTPADTWNARLESLLGEAWTLGTEMTLAAKQDRVPAGTADTAGFFTEDFYLRYQTKKFEAVVRLNNAFDRDYQRHGAGSKDMGRDLRLTLKALY